MPMSELEKKALQKKEDRITQSFSLADGVRQHGLDARFYCDRMAIKTFRIVTEFRGNYWIQTENGNMLTINASDAKQPFFRLSLEKKKLKLCAWVKIPSEDHFCRVRHLHEGVVPWAEKDGPFGWHRLEDQDITLERYL